MANNKNYSNSDMEILIRQKLQELEQLRHNLLHNLRTSSGQAKAYQQMSLEVVEGCQEALREIEEKVLKKQLTKRTIPPENLKSWQSK